MGNWFKWSQRVFSHQPPFLLRCTHGSFLSVFDFKRFYNLSLSRFKCCRSNISKTSASVPSAFPNTRKLTKARSRRSSAFVVFECLKTPMKHEARVFEIASQSCIINQGQWKYSHWFWHRKRNINYSFCYCFSVITGLCCQIF